MTTRNTKTLISSIALAGALSLATLSPAMAGNLTTDSLLLHGGKGELNQLAEKNIAAGKYEKALKYLKKASKKPMDGTMRSRVYSDICAVQALNENYDDALESCDKSLGYDDKNWKALNNKGVALTALDRKENAHKILSRALEMSGENKIVLANHIQSADNM
ncbi:hypothetical protein [Emcibacter sp.]|uniref:tetratricopeptide repeat protein n=1 Tax=Emcibacter sp. TaxID=1979954 RepID=UPI002AA6E9C1|nr:hypothetical protein [Emcibacter sp.]